MSFVDARGNRFPPLHEGNAHLHLHVAINLIHPAMLRAAKIVRDHTTLAVLAVVLEVGSVSSGRAVSGATAAAMPDLDQRAAIACLADPASHGQGCMTVERIDTHCSAVFLAGDRACKLKRAIRYAALDYTRARRHAACEAELRLNRRTSPALYLGSLAITRAPGGRLRFGGVGEPLDWVVVMQRFHRADLFDRMLIDGRLDASHCRALGAAIARLHADAEVTTQFGGAEPCQFTFESTAPQVGMSAHDD